MADDDYTASVGLVVIFHSAEQEGLFIKAMDDPDDRKNVLLAMERAANDLLGFDYSLTEKPIWIESAD